VDGLELVAANDDTDTSAQSAVTFDAEEGVDYAIAVDGYGGLVGDIVLNWRLRPPNDDFADAEPLDGLEGTAIGQNRGATQEPGEPAHDNAAGGRSIWYRWTAPDRGRLEMDTFGSDFDTVLAVYRGDALDALDLVAANDDARVGVRQSQVTFDVEAGDAFAIAVDGYRDSSGTVLLSWSLKAAEPAPENDAFDRAQELEGASGRVTGTNRGATSEPGEPEHAGKSGGRSVWYRWTAPVDGTAVFDTFESDFDTLLAVYRGSTVDELTVVAANDDAGDGYQSEVTFSTARGTTYAIAVDGYHGGVGRVQLSWRLA
jgi:hypothetical protein